VVSFHSGQTARTKSGVTARLFPKALETFSLSVRRFFFFKSFKFFLCPGLLRKKKITCRDADRDSRARPSFRTWQACVANVKPGLFLLEVLFAKDAGDHRGYRLALGGSS